MDWCMLNGLRSNAATNSAILLEKEKVKQECSEEGQMPAWLPWLYASASRKRHVEAQKGSLMGRRRPERSLAEAPRQAARCPAGGRLTKRRSPPTPLLARGFGYQLSLHCVTKLCTVGRSSGLAPVFETDHGSLYTWFKIRSTSYAAVTVP